MLACQDWRCGEEQRLVLRYERLSLGARPRQRMGARLALRRLLDARERDADRDDAADEAAYTSPLVVHRAEVAERRAIAVGCTRLRTT